MVRILHFADAHIDIARSGRHDPQTGLPLRALDFLKALDIIVNAAIENNVDMVLFSGDAYRDRTPVPTFQREWGKRMMRLSRAGILTILLVGNHDISPAIGRAHALQEYETLQVPHIRAISRPEFLGPDDLEGRPMQLLALPWVSRSGLMASTEVSGTDLTQINNEIETQLTQYVRKKLDDSDPHLPVVMMAHATIQGAQYSTERSVMLGNDLVLPGSLVRDPRLSYVALGHIHKHQNLNSEGTNPPVIYPGSIERVDFGEAKEKKYYVIAELEAGELTRFNWQEINGRKFFDARIDIASPDSIQDQIFSALPARADMADAIVRLTLEYPKEWETRIDEMAIRQYAQDSFEFHLVRRPRVETRLRIPGDKAVASLGPLELLSLYWKTQNVGSEEEGPLQQLAGELISPAMNS